MNDSTPVSPFSAWFSAMQFPFSAPLSGDVNQIINPWTSVMPLTQLFPWMSFIRNWGAQAGFININNIKSSSPEKEQQIVQQIAGYGQQLGRILDVVHLLVQRVDVEQLSAEEEKEVRRFENLHLQIQQVKADKTDSPETASMFQLIDEMLRLKQKDAELYDRLLNDLQAALNISRSSNKRDVRVINKPT